MYQENLSATLLENNGRLSSGNQTKHIHVRYLLIKDIIVMGDMKVKYFPTGKFWPTTLPHHCKGLVSINSEMSIKEYRRTPQIKTWAGIDPRIYLYPSHRSLFIEVM